LLDKLVAVGEGKAIDMHVVLVDRTRHKHIKQSVLIVGDGLVERLHRCTAGILRRHAQLHLHLFVKHRKQVDLALLRLFGRIDDGEVARHAKSLGVIGCYLG